MSRATAFVLPPAVSLSAAIALLALHPSLDIALVVTIGSTCALPIVARAIAGRFDIFEPIVIANLALLVMYVARPAAMLAQGSQHSFKGYDITSHVRETLVVVLIGAVAMQLGYAAPWAARVAKNLPSARGQWDVGVTVAFSLGLAAIGLSLFAVFLVHAGGMSFLFQLIKGRNSAYDTLYRTSSAYFYGGPALLWPASLLVAAVGLAARRRDLIILSAILTLALALFAGGQGSRITLLPLVLSPVVYFYLDKNRRPGLLLLLVGSYLVLTVGIAYFRDVRTETTHVDRTHVLKKSVADPSYELRQLVVHGIDNDMFESMAAETIVVPSRIRASPIDFLGRIAAKPIPHILWSGKPLSPEEQLIRALYPWERERASSSSGAIGSFYQAGLLPGVFLGMMLVGSVFRIGWEYWRRQPFEITSKLVLVVTLMFVPITLRGGVGDTVARVLFGVVPLILAARICRGVAGPSHSAGELAEPSTARG